MNVSLTPELVELIERKVRSGLYNSQSEVVREALRLMAERDRVCEADTRRLKAALAEGIAQADRGEFIDGEVAFAEIRAALRKRRKLRKKDK